MTLFSSFDISASALTAERLRMDVISNNLANANTTRTPEGGPFRRQVVVFAPRDATRRFAPKRRAGAHPGQAPVVGQGVRVVAIRDDDAPPRLVYDPSHPDADENGMVAMPNVDVVREMVDLISAARAYEANVTTINTLKNMALKALEIGRV
ncbi:MAG: flagellar basal body rod protein FlgC [Firmicutes bacterium]|nr:flagellar basal body rod protein FlgC [Bacillota bacterium]